VEFNGEHQVEAGRRLIYCFVYGEEDPVIVDRAKELVQLLVNGGHLDRAVLELTRENTKIIGALDGAGEAYTYCELKPEEITMMQQCMNAVNPYVNPLRRSFDAPYVLVWAVPAVACAATGIDNEVLEAGSNFAALAAGSRALHQGLDVVQRKMPKYMPLNIKRVVSTVAALPAASCFLSNTCTGEGYEYVAKPLLVVAGVLVAGDAAQYAANYPVLLLMFFGGCCSAMGYKPLAAILCVSAVATSAYTYFMTGTKKDSKKDKGNKPQEAPAPQQKKGGCC
jgi:hypothetical protein